jgi:hypothetical protein
VHPSRVNSGFTFNHLTRLERLAKDSTRLFASFVDNGRKKFNKWSIFGFLNILLDMYRSRLSIDLRVEVLEQDHRSLPSSRRNRWHHRRYHLRRPWNLQRPGLDLISENFFFSNERPIETNSLPKLGVDSWHLGIVLTTKILYDHYFFEKKCSWVVFTKLFKIILRSFFRWLCISYTSIT